MYSSAMYNDMRSTDIIHKCLIIHLIHKISNFHYHTNGNANES